MLRFLFWRLVQSIVVLWAVYTVTFFLLMLTPGDPFISGEKKAPDSVRQALAEKYGLEYLTRTDKATLSVPAKLYYMSRAYVFYLGHAMVGDFGPSIEYQNRTVTEMIRSSLPVSVALGSLA